MKKHKRIPQLRVIVFGYFAMILLGALLLMLPFATRSGESAPPLTALFTATSASCVTGLILQDTATFWSTFGQIVIISLIQIGGLGFMTFAILLLGFFTRRAGLRERTLMAESINTTQLSGMRRLTKHIIIGTALFELIGAVLLSIRFIPRFGTAKGIYYSIFHAISAFCNAGFDLMGSETGKYSSFTAFANDWLVNLVIIALIAIGGLGFLVWEDIYKHRLCFKHYRLHSKIVLLTTAVLLFGGALLLWIFERDSTCAGKSVSEQILISLFGSGTARTAGFNTTDTAALTEGGKLTTILLMFVGGSSGSTAGGVKTTSIVVIFLSAIATMRGRQAPHCMGRRFEDGALRKAVTIVFMNLSLGLFGTLVVAADGFALSDAMFEAFSAIGTVGMTTGITRDLGVFSKLVMIFLMYCGRVGSISFAAALFERKATPPITYPAEEITIG